MNLRFRDPTRVPVLAIAAYVSENGVVYSAEILDRFQISSSTLRRRRHELRRL
jgi:DeoR/GlpR family transcriptional regulator of sugar metabolism